MSIESAAEAMFSTQGAYDPYTQGYQPLIVMGSHTGEMEVRSYIDEILLTAPPLAHMTARMTIQGPNQHPPHPSKRHPALFRPRRAFRPEAGAGRCAVHAHHFPLFQTPPNAKLYRTIGRCVISGRNKRLTASLAALPCSWLQAVRWGRLQGTRPPAVNQYTADSQPQATRARSRRGANFRPRPRASRRLVVAVFGPRPQSGGEGSASKPVLDCQHRGHAPPSSGRTQKRRRRVLSASDGRFRCHARASRQQCHTAQIPGRHVQPLSPCQAG